MKKNFLILLFSATYTLGFSQMTFSERVEYSELATPNDKQLFFVDFWATWCVPCIHVSTYLNTIQEQFRNELYIVSLTQERSDVVRPFLQKHTTKLAVSIDYEGQNFATYKVRALPYGILLNAEGEVLWKGNPANITPKIIRSFLARNKKTIPIYDFLKYSSYKNEDDTAITLQNNFQIRKINIPPSSYPTIERMGDITSVKGSLSQIVAYLLKISSRQVEMKNDYPQYELLIKKEFNNVYKEKEIVTNILSELGYTLHQTTKAGEIIEVQLPLSSHHYWTSDQIDWGDNNPKFLVDENHISADNLSVNDFLYKLSDVLNVPLIIKNAYNASNELFDWQVHYKFFDLMKTNLSDLGIQIEQSSGNYKKYRIE